jgi:hypothetical protein
MVGRGAPPSAMRAAPHHTRGAPTRQAPMRRSVAEPIGSDGNLMPFDIIYLFLLRLISGID